MSEQDFKQISIIYFALAMGQVLFFGVAFFLRYTGNFTAVDDPEFTNLLLIVATIFCPTAIAASFFVFKKKTEEGVKLEGPMHTRAYREACIIKWALIDGASFFSIIGYLLTAHYAFGLLFLVSLSFFLLNKPKKEGFKANF